MLIFDTNEFIFEDEFSIKDGEKIKNFKVYLTWENLDEIKAISEKLTEINTSKDIDENLIIQKVEEYSSKIHKIIFKNELKEVKKTAKTESLFNKIFESLIMRINEVQTKKNIAMIKKKIKN